MAIFIFQMPKLFPAFRASLAVITSGLLLVALTPARGAGYVISAQDRAQASALSQQAYLTFQSGDYAQALGLLQRSDQLKPDQPDGWNLRGMILLRQKSYEKAQEAFARAAALDPGLWAAQFNLAEVQFQRKDYARARAGFERLLAQTDRYKEGNKWELVQYKALVACVLMGDDQAAGKKLAKLPAKGGATPAYFYAQAASAFRHKNPAQAQQSLAAAQAAYPVAMNDLFSDALVQAGWQTPPQPLAALAANVPASPTGNTLPLPSGTGSDGRPAYVVDPALQAASAGPLPVADAPARPIVTPTIPALRNAPPRSRPTPAVAVETPAPTRSWTGSELENGGLLLDE